MKYKTTTKAVRAGSYNVRWAGFCEASMLLSNHEPDAYTCGKYGWNYDVYEVYGVTLCTGFRNTPGKRLSGIDEYEQKAREISMDLTRSYEDKIASVEELLKAFCVMNGGHAE